GPDPAGRDGAGDHHDRSDDRHVGWRYARGGADEPGRDAPRCVRRLWPLAAGPVSRLVPPGGTPARQLSIVDGFSYLARSNGLDRTCRIQVRDVIFGNRTRENIMHGKRTAAPDSTAVRVALWPGHARPGRSAAACARRRD